MRLDELNHLNDPGTAVIYFSPDEGKDAPELLLFEESAVIDSSWKDRATQTGRKLWQKTKDRYEQVTGDLFAGDRFLRRMNGFKKITVLLNQPIETAVVMDRLRAIIRDRSYHHLRWLIIDLLLLPLTLLLVPLPGPNIPGYYLLLRVYSHWHSFRAASRTNLLDVDIRVSNEAKEVNTFLRKTRDIRTALHELRQKYGLRALQEHQFVPQSSLMKEAWHRLRGKNSL